MKFLDKLVNLDSNECDEIYNFNKNYDAIEDLGKRLESRVWYFLHLLNPDKISKKHLTVDLKRGAYEIDVLAEFNDVILVVECKSGESHDVGDNINKVFANKEELTNYLRKNLSPDKPCLYLIVYSGKELSEVNYKKAKESKIDIWDEIALSEYSLVADKLKAKSKQIIFSDLFAQKHLPWGRSKSRSNCIVTKGTYKGHDCYIFQMNPENLLKIAYVHRRNYSNTINSEANSVTYQRILDINKIKKIQQFLGIPGNSFPTPILINFDKELIFTPMAQKNAEKRPENVTPGWLTFPEEYGYAWIIDGQHRLFSYSGMDEIAQTHMMNVIAFSGLTQVEQANLFVDINQNQKSISPDYLWDLYTDIYPEDDDRAIMSILIKNLNSNSNFFKDRIYIPSTSNRNKNGYPLQINNIGVSFRSKASRIYKDLLTKDLKKYFKIIDTFFNYLISNVELKQDWSLGSEGFISSNNGVAVMVYVLNKFYDYLINRKFTIVRNNIPQNRLLLELEGFSKSISKAMINIGVEELNNIKRERSSESGRKSIASEIILAAADFDGVFKNFCQEEFLQSVVEDKNNEFKETLIFNTKDEAPDPELFNDAILGTICAFINAGNIGYLYIGLKDSKEMVGINNEFQVQFDSSIDKLKRFIYDKIGSLLLVRNYSLSDISIEIFRDDPLVLKIKIPESPEGVCILNMGKGKYDAWVKLDAQKKSLLRMKGDERELYLKQRSPEYNKLIADFFTRE